MPPTDNGDWTSNTTLEALARRVQGSRRLLCLTHSKPDGDAIGSTLALARAAIARGQQAAVLYLPPWPERFDAIVNGTPVIHEHHNVWSEPALVEADTIAILDTGSWNQVADARAFLESRLDRVFVVDHHAHGHTDLGVVRYIDSSAASACQIVAELCRQVLNLPAVRDLPADIAAALYLGTATDTGWFRHSNTTPAVLRLAADLIEAGAPHNDLYQLVEQNESISRLRVLSRALANLRLLDDGRVAMVSLDRKEIAECDAVPDDLGGLSDLPGSIASVRVTAVLIEMEPRLTKLSLRSKPARPGEPLIDVNQIAQTLGGGGHVQASGAKLHMPLDQAKKAVAAALGAVLHEE